MGRRMQQLRVLGFAFLTGLIAAGCAKGRDVKSAGKEDKLAFDESGKGSKCEDPKSSCDEVTEPSLDFKEKCREAGFRMKQCGCDNLCSGNIKGDRQGFTSKNEQKTCKQGDDKCELQETSAAYQDACDMAGGELMECGCEWLCSKKLKEAIPDPPKEEEKKADEAGGDKAKDDKAKDEKKDDKAKDEKKAHGNMDGRSAEEIAKDKAAQEKAAKDKAAEEKAAKDKSKKDKSDSPDSSSGGKKKSRFFNE
jgi:colicin import membrane protein